MPFGPVSTKPEQRPQHQLPADYPQGWWIPKIDPVGLAVEGSPEMTAVEYRVALRAKIANLIEKEGKADSVSRILAMLEPAHPDLDPEASAEQIAAQVLDLLPFPGASPEEDEPADLAHAMRAVKLQEDLDLESVLTAAFR
jgi:hypothetical protein